MVRRVYGRSLAWGLLFAFGCASTGEGCTGCMEPIPGGFPDGTAGKPDLRISNAAGVKVTRHGLDFFESRVNDIVKAFAGDGLNMNLGCMNQTQSLDFGVGTMNVPVYVCDLDGTEAAPGSTDNNCTTGTSRRLCPEDASAPTTPGQCTCQVSTSVKLLRIVPSQDASGDVHVAVTLELRVNTGRIPVYAKADLWPWDAEVHCSVEFDSDAFPTDNVPVDVTVNLTLDPAYGNVLAYDIEEIDITNVFQPEDLEIGNDGGAFSWVLCNAAGLDFVKNWIVDLLKGTINLTIRDMLDTFRCRACAPVTNNCPQGSSCNAQQKVCYISYRPNTDPAQDVRTCPPALLGLEGRLGVGALLSSFGAPADGKLDVYAVAGGKNPDGKPAISGGVAEKLGIKVGMMGGTAAPAASPCVPPKTWTQRPQPGSVDFDKEATTAAIGEFSMGLSLSDTFLDKAMFDAYSAGLLCLNVDSSVSALLSSSLFRTFLPSLGVLIRDQGGPDVPMLVALRPRTPPNIVIGKGTTKLGPGGEEIPDDALLTVNLQEVQIDFYALLEDRYSRLFSLTADISLPLSLRFDSVRNTVKPVLGSLSGAIANVKTSNNEMLADDLSVVEKLITSVIGLVEPLLATVLAPIELPTIQGFKAVVKDARGVVAKQPGPGFEHMAMFAELDLMPVGPQVAEARTSARIVESFVPDLDGLRGGETPRVVLEVDATGPRSGAFRGWNYTWRVDGGLWSPYVAGPRITVAAPLLMLPGRHVVEVAAHEAGVFGAPDAQSARVEMLVDYEAPTVRLEADPDAGVLRTVASDGTSAAEALVFRYRADDGAWGEPGAARDFRLDEVKRLEVGVTDEAGRSAMASWTAQQAVEAVPVGTAAQEQGGCAQPGIAAFMAAGLLALLGRRRRAR